MVDVTFPRFQEVVVPILRDTLGDEAHVSTWVDDIDYREYPIVNVRRLGGYRSRNRWSGLDMPVIEMTAYHDAGLIEAEELYNKALEALFDARDNQTVVEAGSIPHVREVMGMTQFSSLFQDSWRVQGLIELGIRPNRRKLNVIE